MIQEFSQTYTETQRTLSVYALVDGLLAFLAVGLVSFGLDAVFRAMH